MNKQALQRLDFKVTRPGHFKEEIPLRLIRPDELRA